MSYDNEARAREIADTIRAIHAGNGPVPKEIARHFDPILSRKDATAMVLAAIDAAETRGRIAGLEEAREIASGSFGWDMSVWRDMTKKDMTRLMAEAIVEAIDARLVTIAPPAETTEPATGSI